MNKRVFISRRAFLKTCTTTAAATGLPFWFVERQLAGAAEAPTATPPASANERPGIALIGCGGQGGTDIGNAANYGDIVALCDVDEGHVNGLVRRYSRNGKTPSKYSDFRRLLEQKDVNIVVQGTPDHWHSLINIGAAKAKKDIYAEKPLTLTIDEGRRVIKAVRDNKVVLQTGTQQRSSTRFLLACELIRNQRFGKLKTINVWLPAGLRAGPFQTKPIPQGLNWDFWLGQAPKVDYLSERCHSSFRWWWDYSGGPVTDWGAHHNDIARWAIGQDGPLSVEAKVITPPIPGGYITPSEYEATLTWADGVTQVVKTTTDDSPFGQVLKRDGQRNGIKFECANGWLWVNRDEISASDPDLLRAPLPEGAIRLESSRNHMGNFIQSVKSRKDPICPVEGGHYSAVVGHLIVIALRTGLKLKWDPAKEEFTGEGAETANAMKARPMRAPYDYTFVG